VLGISHKAQFRIALKLIFMKVLDELLKKVYFFYPIGCWEYRKNYPGYLQIEKIIENKINNEVNNPTSVFNHFINEVNTEIKGLKIENRSYYQFPNYIANISLKEQVNDIGILKENMIICISLLADFYTIFFEEQFLIESKQKLRIQDKSSFHIYSFETFLDTENSPIVDIIKKKIASFFPDKKYVSHYLIKNFIVGGFAPYGEEYSYELGQVKYSLFDFLFFANPLIPRPAKILL